MRVMVEGIGAVDLGSDSFVAEGGEAAVYAKDGVAFKIYRDPGAMIAPAKIAELGAIADAYVVKPERVVRDASGRALGFTMAWLQDAWTLCQLFPRAFRERHAITLERSLALVRSLQARVASAHRAGCLIVDLSDHNFLVDRALSDVWAIDVDSWRTPHFPARAITPAIRDPFTPLAQLGPGSDWFSFAIVSFQLFCGLHPYRGNHPNVHGLEARMQARLSVLDPSVQLPRAAYPPSVIPEAYRAWYRAVLEEGRRTPPPDGPMTCIELSAWAPEPLDVATKLSVVELARVAGAVRRVVADGRTLLIESDRGLWLDGRRLERTGIEPLLAKSTAHGYALSPRSHRPVAVSLGADGAVHALDLTARVRLALDLRASQLAESHGRVHLLAGDRLVALTLSEVGASLVASTRTVGRCLPKATQLFPGLAVQSLLGASYLSLLDNGCRQIRVPELDGARVLAARHERGVVVAVVRRGTQLDRVVLRANESGYDLRVVEDVPSSDVDFAVLDNGVSACLDEQDRLELFRAEPNSASLRAVDDKLIAADLRLFANGLELCAWRGAAVYRLSLR